MCQSLRLEFDPSDLNPEAWSHLESRCRLPTGPPRTFRPFGSISVSVRQMLAAPPDARRLPLPSARYLVHTTEAPLRCSEYRWHADIMEDQSSRQAAFVSDLT